MSVRDVSRAKLPVKIYPGFILLSTVCDYVSALHFIWNAVPCCFVPERFVMQMVGTQVLPAFV